MNTTICWKSWPKYAINTEWWVFKSCCLYEQYCITQLVCWLVAWWFMTCKTNYPAYILHLWECCYSGMDVESVSLIYYHTNLSCDAFLINWLCHGSCKHSWVETNITTLILILPNGLGLVILYTMKYEIQSVYRTVFLETTEERSIYNGARFCREKNHSLGIGNWTEDDILDQTKCMADTEVDRPTVSPWNGDL